MMILCYSFNVKSLPCADISWMEKSQRGNFTFKADELEKVCSEWQTEPCLNSFKTCRLRSNLNAKKLCKIEPRINVLSKSHVVCVCRKTTI